MRHYLVIHLARIHAFKSGIFELIDVNEAEIEDTKARLLADGYVISHIEHV